LVYGGGNNGLMGLVAQATADAGGRVIGIIPNGAPMQKKTPRTAVRLNCMWLTPCTSANI
jgi:predicted Rossmann-fold nucleotide-binding protein